MKKICLILAFILIMISLSAKDFVTVYNDNFALIRSQFDITLEKGIQNYLYEEIPSQIETNSVIFKSVDNKVMLFNQNYEYDLASKDAILKKYLNQSISLTTEDNKEIRGILQFNESNSIGIINPNSKELMIVNLSKIKDINLMSLPDNFYLKPTLRWELQTPSKGTYPIELSYLTQGLSWFVTYNTVFKNDKLDITAWVTLNNTSGKAYENINLKLMAGSVNKILNRNSMFYEKGRGNFDTVGMGAPQFEEKSFADYHLYTLDQLVSIANNQEKLLQLFPLKTTNAKKFYSFDVFGSPEIDQNITFTNSKSNGLGIPLPKGVVKMYQQDTDQNMEFIGESEISHTAIDQRIILTIGKAFDLVKEVKELSDQTNKNINTKVISVRIENKKKESADIEVYHSFGGNTKIVENEIPFLIDNAYRIVFKLSLKAGEIKEFKFKQIVKY